MANKKYVIMQTVSPGERCTVCPTVAVNDNRQIKSYQKCGYKIVGRVSCSEGFIPDYVVTDVIHKQRRRRNETINGIRRIR